MRAGGKRPPAAHCVCVVGRCVHAAAPCREQAEPYTGLESLFGNDFTASLVDDVQSIRIAEDFKAFLIDRAQAHGTDTAGAQLTSDKINATIDGVPFADAWAAGLEPGVYPVVFTGDGNAVVRVSMNLLQSYESPHIDGQNFIATREELEGMGADEIKELFFGRAQVTGYDLVGAGLTAGAVDMTIDGVADLAAADWANDSYLVTFTIPGSNLSKAVMLTMYDRGTGPAVPGSGGGQGDESGKGWIVGDDFQATVDDLLNSDGSIPSADDLGNILKGLANVQGGNADGTQLDLSDVEVLVGPEGSEQTLADYLAGGGGFGPGTYRIVFVAPDGVQVAVTFTVTEGAWPAAQMPGTQSGIPSTGDLLADLRWTIALLAAVSLGVSTLAWWKRRREDEEPRPAPTE